MKLFLVSLSSLLAVSSYGQTSLDNFLFDDTLFGDSLVESDQGIFSFGNWLNVISSRPGNPAYLTGPHFNTGIANIGLSGNPTYTIGYNIPIFNRVGPDLGVVVARYTEDTVRLAVSVDGTSFSTEHVYQASDAIDTGVHKLYYYGGGGPFDAELFVQPVELSDYGVGIGNSILATRVSGTPQLDLIRVAGFYDGTSQTLSCQMFLQDTGPFVTTRTINYTLTLGSTTIASGPILATNSYTPFVVSTNRSHSGSASLTLDGASFLRKSVTVVLTGTNQTLGQIDLQNGDVDMSGEVDAADIDEVILQFGQLSTVQPDVDASGEVDAADIDIVIANFGALDQ